MKMTKYIVGLVLTAIMSLGLGRYWKVQSRASIAYDITGLCDTTGLPGDNIYTVEDFAAANEFLQEQLWKTDMVGQLEMCFVPMQNENRLLVISTDPDVSTTSDFATSIKRDFVVFMKTRLQHRTKTNK